MEGKLTSKCMVERWKGLELRTLLEDPREKRANDSQFSPDCKAIMSVLASLNTKKTLYIGGLDDAVTEQVVQMAFMPFGEIAQVVMPTETGTQKHKGFAFVEFDLAEDAEHALFNMNNAELYGRVLKLSYAKPQALARNKAIWEVLEADTAGPQEGDGAEDQAQVDV